MLIEMHKKNQLIVFEGVVGTGKSTVGNLFAARIGSILMETPIEPFASARKQVNQSNSLNAQFLFYVSANLYVSSIFPDLLKDSSLVSIRYFYSSFVDYSVRFGLGVAELFDKVSLSPDDFTRPDKTFMLYASPEVQLKRIEARNHGHHAHTDQLVIQNSEYRQEISRRYLNIAAENRWHVIDTSSKSISDVVDECLKEFQI
jgi:thymidylate kinase